MARLDNVVLVCGGGAEALDVLVGDGEAAAVHCMRMQRAVLVSRAERRVRRQLPRAPCVERQQQPLGPAPTAHRPPRSVQSFFPLFFLIITCLLASGQLRVHIAERPGSRCRRRVPNSH
jgi:hypothetical protein